jgi:hypothetical protein
MSLRTVQEMVDTIVAPLYRQPVKTLAEALDALGWEHVDKPTCCGSEVRIRSFLGDAYFVQCDVCKKFAVDVAGTSFGNGSVTLTDPKKVDLSTGRTWIAGIENVGPLARDRRAHQ